MGEEQMCDPREVLQYDPEDRRPKREIDEERREQLGEFVEETMETAKKRLAQTGNHFVGPLFRFLDGSHSLVFGILRHGTEGEQHALADLARFLASPTIRGTETTDWIDPKDPLPSGRLVRKQDRKDDCLILASIGKTEESSGLDGRLTSLGVNPRLLDSVSSFFRKGKGAQVVVVHRRQGVIFEAGISKAGGHLEIGRIHSGPDDSVSVKIDDLPLDPATGEKVDPIKCLARLFTA